MSSCLRGASSIIWSRKLVLARGQTGDSYTIVSNHTLMSIDQLSKASSRAFFLHMGKHVVDWTADVLVAEVICSKFSVLRF